MATIHYRFARFERMLEKALRKDTAPETPRGFGSTAPREKTATADDEETFAVTQRIAKATAADDFDSEEEKTRVFGAKG